MGKRILIIIPTTNSGGAENYTLRFIKWYGTEDTDWHVLSPLLTPGSLDAAFKAMGVKVKYHRLGYFAPQHIWWFLKWAKSKKFDAIVTLTGTFGALPISLARLIRIPIRIAWHRRSTNAFKEGVFTLFYNWMMTKLLEANSTSILSNSIQALRFFHGKKSWASSNLKYQVVYNGVDHEYFNQDLITYIPLYKDTYTVGHVGRYDPAKNHEFIFEVIKILAESKLDFKFLFLGEGTNSKSFIDKVNNLGIRDFVECIGNVEDVRAYYKSMDLFFFPSKTEGQPNALVEAILMEVPFIASNIQPLKDLLPTAYRHRLVDLSSPKDAARRIKNEIAADNKKEVDALRLWAMKTFDPDKNFNLFKKVL